MAYANLTPNLQDMFNQINDRLRKLESGPNSAAYAAASAQSTAYTSAVDAAAAQALAASAVQVSANTIVNATNQLTALNSSGITVYSGASATSGARVLMNSLGLVGYNSGGTPTFSLSSSDGSLALTGSIISGGSISGATVTATAGTVGGWTLNSSYLTDGSTTFLKPLSSSTQYSIITGAGISASSVTVGTGVVSGNTYSFSVGGTSFLTGNTTVNGTLTAGNYIYNTGAATTTSSANVFMNSSSGLIARVTSSERYKVEIAPEAIPAQSVMALIPKSYVDKAEYEANNNSATGLPRYLGLIAEDLAQLPVLKDLLVNYNEEGQPDSVNYDRIAIALVPLVQDLNNRLIALEAK